MATDDDGRLVGTVVRLQVQRSPLKPGGRGARRYDPAPLLEVDELEVGPRGVVGLTPGGRVLDVHHADHPLTRNRRLANGLSLLPVAHALGLRERFGDHLADGAVGESLLLDVPGGHGLDEADLAGGLRLETVDGGHVVLPAVTAAPPCVEFTRFALGRDDTSVDEEVLRTLDSLGGGRRGFYAVVEGTGRIARGARLTRT